MRCCPTTTPMVVGSKLLCADRSFPEDVSECNLHSRPSTRSPQRLRLCRGWTVVRPLRHARMWGVFGGLAALARDPQPALP